MILINSVKKFFNIPFGYFLILIQFFMLINTEFFFPNNTEFYRNMIIMFLLSFVLMYAMPDIRAKVFRVKLKDYLPKYIIFLVLGIVLLKAGSFFAGVGEPKAITLNIGVLALNWFVIASIEELIFRNMLVKKFGQIPAMALFGVFHLIAYQLAVIKIVYAMIMHVVLYMVQQKFSKNSSAANSGLHTAINYFQGVGL